MWQLMWFSLLLSGSQGSSEYWDFVRAANGIGCRVFNDYYISCPMATPPPDAEFVPLDAIEVIADEETI